MKRFLSLLLLVILMLSILVSITACTTGTCDFCGEEGVRVEKRDLFGEDIYVCKDCINEINSLFD